MNLTFLHVVPRPSAAVHGIQMEGLYTVNSALGTVTFSYRELLADPSDPTRLTPKPSDVVKQMTVPLTSADLIAITQVVLSRAVALGQTDGTMTPAFAAGGPESAPSPVTLSVEMPGAVLPLSVTQLKTTVTGAADKGVLWTLLEGGGTLTPGGLYTAGATVGVARVFVVSIADPLKSSSGSIATVLVLPTVL